MLKLVLALFLIPQQPQIDPLLLSEIELEQLIQERAKRILTGSTGPRPAAVSPELPPPPPSFFPAMPQVVVHSAKAAPPSIVEPPLRSLARSTAEEFGILPHLAFGLIEVESAWNPKAVSNKGAVGLAQVLPSTARGIGFNCDLLEPECSLRAGFAYLKSMLETFGDPRLALAAYNAGPGVFRKNYSPATRESIVKYVRDVIHAANRIQNAKP